MRKDKADAAGTLKHLSQYKFNTSNYIILKEGIRRDVNTGKLLAHKNVAPKDTPKKAK